MMQQIGNKTIDLTQLGSLTKFSSFFKTGEIEKIAKQTGFISRSSSRLTGEAFLKMMVQHIAPDKEWSLNDQCDYLEEQFGIHLTKQSLDERYHTFAVSFLKRCYEAVLDEAVKNKTKGLTSDFSGIYLTDATSFQLPGHLSAFYQSNGGDTSGSSVKIHQTIELLKFRIADFVITDGKDSDGNYWENKNFELDGNSLWIADLGYFSWDTLTQIAASGNYFLSRYKTGTTLYTKNSKEEFIDLDIEKYVQQIGANNGVQNATIYFGKKKIQGRLICEGVPQEVKQQRLDKYRKSHANQSKNRQQWEMTATKELLCGYNLYITNATEKKLPTSVVFSIYGLRWQIELLFKIWKSLLFIDNVPPMNICRFECFLYGRLLFILLSTELIAYIKSARQEDGLDIEISDWKTMKMIKKNATN
jgi:hypothetical protein